MWVGVVASSAVHIQDARVQGLLVVQGKGHGIHTAPPVLSAWFLQHNIDNWMNISIDKRTTKKKYLYIVYSLRYSGAKSGLPSCSGIPAASRPVPSPSPSAPGKNWRSLARRHHPCRNTSPGEVKKPWS